MGEFFSTTSPLKVHIRLTPKKSCILLGRASTKVVQRIAKFQIFEFLPLFFSFSLTWDHMGIKFQTTSLKEHTRFAPQNSCIFL